MRRPGYFRLLSTGILFVAVGLFVIGWMIVGTFTYGFYGARGISVTAFSVWMLIGLFNIILGVVGILRRNGFDGMTPLIIAARIYASVVALLFLLSPNIVFFLFLPIPIVYAAGASRNNF